MDINKVLASFQTGVKDSVVEKEVKKITGNISAIYTVQTLKQIFGFIDLTTLNGTDTCERAKQFAENINNFPNKFPEISNVAAICVYPTLLEHIKNSLTVKNVKITSVTGGFPSAQTFIDLKISETKKAIEKGANEIDMVISTGTFLSGNYHAVYEEIKAIKDACGINSLKVILESGVLENLTNVKIASIIAIEAGADFLQTSTGKVNPPATPEAVYVMAQIIKEYEEKTDKKIGIKPAGGISDSQKALKYYALVKEILGEEYLNPKHFRIGSKELANALLNDIAKMSSDQKEIISYF